MPAARDVKWATGLVKGDPSELREFFGVSLRGAGGDFETLICGWAIFGSFSPASVRNAPLAFVGDPGTDMHPLCEVEYA